MDMRIQLLREGARVPSLQTEEAAGFDLYAAEERVVLTHARVLVPLGFAAVIPSGCAAFIWDRSGLAAKHGITVLGGVIDADYRGEWHVVLLNTGLADVVIGKGERVAQMVVQHIVRPALVSVEALPPSVRGAGGFGSTGQ